MIVKSSVPFSYIYSNVKIKIKTKSIEKYFIKDFLFDDNLLPIFDYS